VEVPAGAGRLTVRFEPRWSAGLPPAALLAVLGGLAAVACAWLTSDRHGRSDLLVSHQSAGSSPPAKRRGAR